MGLTRLGMKVDNPRSVGRDGGEGKHKRGAGKEGKGKGEGEEGRGKRRRGDEVGRGIDLVHSDHCLGGGRPRGGEKKTITLEEGTLGETLPCESSSGFSLPLPRPQGQRLERREALTKRVK